MMILAIQLMSILPVDEEIENIRNLIYSVSKLRSSDAQISNIISEETPLFFNGSKSAEEVADIVASRVQLYVNEQK